MMEKAAAWRRGPPTPPQENYHVPMEMEKADHGGAADCQPPPEHIDNHRGSDDPKHEARMSMLKN